MGEVGYNRKLLTRMIEVAAGRGAAIVVTPECAVQGYLDPLRDVAWTKAAARADRRRPVAAVAEPVPGAATRYFGRLAAKYKLYLCLGMIEAADGKFYNAQVLLDPKGEIAAHHRKQTLWPPGDISAFEKANEKVQVVETEYGRLGLMICYEVHTRPPKLARAKADIVLYSVAWYGGNTRNWFRNLFPRLHVKPHGYAVIAANWSSPLKGPSWAGAGYSAIYDASGKVLAQVDSARKPRVLVAELPLRRRRDRDDDGGG